MSVCVYLEAQRDHMLLFSKLIDSNVSFLVHITSHLKTCNDLLPQAESFQMELLQFRKCLRQYPENCIQCNCVIQKQHKYPHSQRNVFRKVVYEFQVNAKQEINDQQENWVLTKQSIKNTISLSKADTGFTLVLAIPARN